MVLCEKVGDDIDQVATVQHNLDEFQQIKRTFRIQYDGCILEFLAQKQEKKILAAISKENTGKHNCVLECGVEAEQYITNTNEAETSVMDKEPIRDNSEYGKSGDWAEEMMRDLHGYHSVVDGLREKVQACKDRLKVQMDDRLVFDSAAYVTKIDSSLNVYQSQQADEHTISVRQQLCKRYCDFPGLESPNRQNLEETCNDYNLEREAEYETTKRFRIQFEGHIFDFPVQNAEMMTFPKEQMCDRHAYHSAARLMKDIQACMVGPIRLADETLGNYRELRLFVDSKDAKEEAWITETHHLPSLDEILKVLCTILVELGKLSKMYIYLALLLPHVAVVYPMEVTASYSTSFQCRNGSYALISGADLILKYDYGYSHTQLQSFHLYELYKGRHLLDYESAAGQVFMKDQYNRLKNYTWTERGIELTITAIQKEIDSGKYEGYVDIGENYKQKSIEIQNIFDPPKELKITTNATFEEEAVLFNGFKEYTFEASVEAYADIACSNIIITWVLQTKENLQSCQLTDDREPTVCPFTLKETELTADECIILDVYAEQYDIKSNNKTYRICYNSTNENGDSADVPYIQIIIGMAVGIVMLVVIIVVIVSIACLKSKGPSQENAKVKYKAANKDDDGGTDALCEQANVLKVTVLPA